MPLWSGVLVTIVSTLLILVLKNYGMKILEIIFAVLIAIMAVCFFINTLYVKPNVGDVMEGIAVP